MAANQIGQSLKKVISNFVIILIFSSTSFSQTDPQASDKNSVGLLFDQDVLVGPLGLNEDRNYTQGLGVYFSCKKLRNVFDKYFRLRYPSNNVTNFPTIVTLQLGGFTPDDLRDSLIIQGDRPYSSVIFLSFKDSRLDNEKFRLRNWTFYLGALGVPNVAKNGQSFIHSQFNQNNTKPPYLPEGWHNQISQGGEPTLMVSYEVKHLFSKRDILQEFYRGKESDKKGIRSQLSGGYQFDLGYLTQFQFGLDYRIGIINLKRWHSSSQWYLESTSTKKKTVENSNELENNYFKTIEKPFEFYFFAGIKSGLMVYNASLHGQFRQSAYRLPYWDTGFFRNTGRVGLTLNTKCMGLSVYYAFKNSEITTEYARVHSWGGITLNWNW
ncbi:MAG: lipid A-modifier LpxR family protein [Putridiphycobacter sp.]